MKNDAVDVGIVGPFLDWRMMISEMERKSNKEGAELFSSTISALVCSGTRTSSTWIPHLLAS